MNIASTVSSLFGQGETLIHECRRCGTTLGRCDDPCPYCGPTGVETFSLGGS